MTDVPPEVVARGRAIFERLRGGAGESDAAEDAAPGEPETEPEPATGEPEPHESAGDHPSGADADSEPDAVPAATSDESTGEGGPDAEESTGEGTGEGGPGGGPPSGPHDGGAPTEALEAPLAPPEPPVPADDSVVDETRPDPRVPDIEASTAPPKPSRPQMAPDARAVPVATGERSFARPLPRVLAIANQKGGVGKTTTAVNLAACLADLGFRVLVVDLDPQGNASTGLGINTRDLETSMYDVLLHDAPLEDCIESSSVRNLFVAPSNLDLAGAEIELVPAFSRELKLRTAIADVRDDYDYVFVDCPPSLGLLTVNGLAAATEVLVPIQCEYYALEGLGQLLRNVGLVQRNLNPSLEVSVIVCVMYDARTKLADQVVQEVRDHFGEAVCRTVIPRTVRLSEAPSYGQPIIAFDPTSRGAIAYRELAREVSGDTPNRAG